MVRHARMTGRPTLWLPGLDHASIAAQVVLDRIIEREGETRASLGRERYLERMWAFVTETRATILRQSRRFGSSLDWDRLRFTMDEVSATAVRAAFSRLYRDGLAYRTEALANWCVGCQTTVSDLEVVPTPEQGTLWTIRYHLVDDAGVPQPGRSIEIATTRPETLLGDVAVAVHPDDSRYVGLVGARVVIPFVDRIVPVIADEAVRPEFGTGAVKITPAHDPDDYATGRRHELPMINVFDDAGRINENGSGYAGLDLLEARRRILADLDARGDLVAALPHEMLIGRCQRSNDIIEPRLKTQWFIRTKPLAEQALVATRSGQTRILPERFDGVWEHWLTEIRDWNVSRQLWWGHRIPAWYCPDGHVTVSALVGGPDACATCAKPAATLTQDPDIFDTWFSSGLWPFSTLGWPDDTPDPRFSAKPEELEKKGIKDFQLWTFLPNVGDYVGTLGEDSAVDSGQVAIPAGTLKKPPDPGPDEEHHPIPPDQCTVTAYLTKSRDGQVDPAFSGGTFKASQVRSGTFTSVP